MNETGTTSPGLRTALKLQYPSDSLREDCGISFLNFSLIVLLLVDNFKQM